MGHEHHGGPGGHGIDHQPVDQVAGLLVQRGVRLVEQPQLGTTGHQHGQRGAAALSGRQAGHRHAGEAPVEAEPGHGGVDVGGPGPSGPGPEPHVVGHGEVGVEPAGVTEQADPVAHRPGIHPQVHAQHPR